MRDWVRPSLVDAPTVPIMRDFLGYRAQVWTLVLFVGAKAFGLFLVVISPEQVASDSQRTMVWLLAIDLIILLQRRFVVPGWFIYLNVTAAAVAGYWLLGTTHTLGTLVGTMLTVVVGSTYAAVWFPARQVALQVTLLLGFSLAGLLHFYISDAEAVAIWGLTASTSVALALVLRALVRQVQRRATHDDLTQVLNRVGLRAVVEHGSAPIRPNALVAIDLDDFKRVNDEQGHMAGDALLREVARQLRDGVRPDDIVVRMGGDEFMLLLPHTSEAEARITVQRLLPSLPIGASFGVSEWLSADDFDAAQARADAAMYQQKARRRS